MTNTDSLNTLLEQCYDPFLQLNMSQMGFKSKQDKDSIRLLAGFPINPLLPNLKNQFEKAKKQMGISQSISLDYFIRAHRTQLTGKGLRGIKNVIAIASGKGGVGKSTVTVNLAIALAKAGARVGILDADIYGPSIPLMLGKHQPVQIVDDRYSPVFVHGIQAMSIAYLSQENQALIWRGPMLAKTLLHMIDFTNWQELDYLFIDLPPGTGDIQLSLVQKIPLTAAVVVSTPQNVATLDAQKAIQMFQQTQVEVLGLIENMATHVCSNCQHKEAIFGEGGIQKLSDNWNIPILGQLPLHARIRQHCDSGQPTALHDEDILAKSYLQTALHLAINLAQKPLNFANSLPDVVVE